MKRRDILKGALTSATAWTAGAQHPHPNTAPSPSNAAWKPLLFDTHQNDTVIALAELIIPRTDTPGATDARVNEYIDLILHDGPSEPRVRFLEGLGWLDGYALRLHQRPFVRCDAGQQTAILRSLDRETASSRSGTLNRAGTPDRASEPDRAVSPPERPGGPANVEDVAAAKPDLTNGELFFRQLKMLTVQGYYTSKIGIDELNKGGRVPGSFGCAQTGNK